MELKEAFIEISTIHVQTTGLIRIRVTAAIIQRSLATIFYHLQFVHSCAV